MDELMHYRMDELMHTLECRCAALRWQARSALECVAHAQRSCGSVRTMGGASLRTRPRAIGVAARQLGHRAHAEGTHLAIMPMHLSPGTFTW